MRSRNKKAALSDISAGDTSRCRDTIFYGVDRTLFLKWFCKGKHLKITSRVTNKKHILEFFIEIDVNTNTVYK